MIVVNAQWINQHVTGEWHNLASDHELLIESVTTDTRTIKAGELFVALRGDNFDGHDFIDSAIKSGAGALITDTVITDRLPSFVVPDSRIALGQLAKAVKNEVAPKTVAMTGSSGKTTVKEMCGCILSQCGPVWTTPGNFNNDIGVPLSLLGLTHQHEYAVFELGANHANEIAYTVDLVTPDTCTILNVSEAHLQGFGSIDGVALAKSEIYTHAPQNTIRIINTDNQHGKMWQTQIAAANQSLPVTISVQNEADFYATDIRLSATGCSMFKLHSPLGEVELELTIPGQHNVANALAAAALCMQVGATLKDVKAGFNTLKPVKGRLFTQQLGPLTLIDDTYNANVGSVKAAIRVLAQMDNMSVLVIGDMGELGDESTSLHTEIGEYAKRNNVDHVFAFGQYSAFVAKAFGTQGQHFTSQIELANALMALYEVQNEMTILVKGSRSTKMEQVVSLIEHNVLTKTEHNGEPD